MPNILTGIAVGQLGHIGAQTSGQVAPSADDITIQTAKNTGFGATTKPPGSVLSALGLALPGVNASANSDPSNFTTGYPIDTGVVVGSPVYLRAVNDGGFGVIASLAVGTSEATAQVIGIVGAVNGSFGAIYSHGSPFILINPDVIFDNPDNWVPGAIVYLSTVTAGKMTVTEPGSGWVVKIGTITPTGSPLQATAGPNVISLNISRPTFEVG